MKKLLTAALCGSILFVGCQKPENPTNNTQKKAPEATAKTVSKDLKKSPVKKDVVQKKKVTEAPFVLPDVVAKVNGVAIKKSEISKQIERIEKRLSQMKHQVTNKDRKQYAKNIIDRVVRQKMIKAYITDHKVAIDEKELDKMFQKRKSFFKKKGEFESYLKRIALTEAELKERLKDGLLTQKLFEDHVFKDIKIDDKAIKEYYTKNEKRYVQEEQVKASHILVKLPPKATDAQKAEKLALIKKILGEIKKGGDFAALAKKHSDCPSGKRGGGDLGFFTAGKMVPAFSKATFALKDGAISDIVQTQFGYHIIKRTGYKAGKKLALTDEITGYRGKKNVKDQIKETLEGTLKRDKAKSFYEELKKQYKVELFI